MTAGSADELSLIARTVDGDHAAFQILLHRYLPAINRYAIRMTGNQADAADISQEVFMRFWEKAGSFDPNKARLSTWLHQIAHNLCVDHFRRAKGEQKDEQTFPGGEEAADDTQEDSAQQVQKALSALPERQRSALLFCHYQGLSNRQAAEIIGVSVEALESLLARARKTLRHQLMDNPNE